MPLLNQIENLCDVDVAFAVKQMGGSEDMYLVILQTFHNSIVRKLELLSRFLSEEKWDEYRIEVHSQKSALGNVGAKALSELARKLEIACSKGNLAYVVEQHPAYIEAVMAAHRKIGMFLPAAPAEAERKAASDEQKAALTAKLIKMKELLDDLEGDEALALATELSGQDYGAEKNDRLSGIRQSIENFEYDAATDAILKEIQ